MLMEQKYGGEKDYTEHFYSVLPVFEDNRYIRVEGKPVFLIYDAFFKDVTVFINLWRQLALQNGLEGIYFIGMTSSTLSFKFDANREKIKTMPNTKSSADIYNYVLSLGFDAVNSFGKRRGEMLCIGKYRDLFMKTFRLLGLNISTDKYDYAKTVKGYFAPEDKWENVYPTILPQWDRTARIGKAEEIYIDSTPQKFANHIKDALNIIKDKQSEHRILFLKSWNEWAEGNYVEPDLKFGHGYLDALKSTLI
jgi:hypothetical protein